MKPGRLLAVLSVVLALAAALIGVWALTKDGSRARVTTADIENGNSGSQPDNKPLQLPDANDSAAIKPELDKPATVTDPAPEPAVEPEFYVPDYGPEIL